MKLQNIFQISLWKQWTYFVAKRNWFYKLNIQKRFSQKFGSTHNALSGHFVKRATKCAARKDAATVGENLLRTDDGVKTDKNLSTTDYFKRSLKLVGQEIYLFVGAFVLLLCYVIFKIKQLHNMCGLTNSINDNILYLVI